MKRTKSLRLASVLLMLCLATTCAVSGTFAKYVTSDNASDTARVAKWGVTVLVDGTLFGTAYASNSATENEDSIVATSTNVAGDSNVVAPGTKNEVGMTFSVTGTPEVSYAITTANTNTTDIYLKAGKYGVMVPVNGVNNATNFDGDVEYYTENANTYTKVTNATFASTTAPYYKLQDVCDFTGDTYYPIVWTVTKVAGTTGDEINAGRLSDIVTALNGKFANSYNANAPINLGYTLTWAWAFEEGATDEEKAAQNAKDTILAQIVAGANVVVVTDTSATAVVEDTHYCYNIEFDYSITVTQVN